MNKNDDNSIFDKFTKLVKYTTHVNTPFIGNQQGITDDDLVFTEKDNDYKPSTSFENSCHIPTSKNYNDFVVNSVCSDYINSVNLNKDVFDQIKYYYKLSKLEDNNDNSDNNRSVLCDESNSFYQLSFYHVLANSIQLGLPMLLDHRMIKACIQEIVQLKLHKLMDDVGYTDNSRMYLPITQLLNADPVYNNHDNKHNNGRPQVSFARCILTKHDEYKTVTANLNHAEVNSSQIDSDDNDNDDYDSYQSYNVKIIVSDDNKGWNDLINEMCSIVSPLKCMYSESLLIKYANDMIDFITRVRILKTGPVITNGILHESIMLLIGRFITDKKIVDLDNIPIHTKRYLIKSNESDKENKLCCVYDGIWCTKQGTYKGIDVLELNSDKLLSVKMNIAFDNRLDMNATNIINGIDMFIPYCIDFNDYKTTDGDFLTNIWKNNIGTKKTKKSHINLDIWTQIMNKQDKDEIYEKLCENNTAQNLHIILNLSQYNDSNNLNDACKNNGFNKNDIFLNIALCTLNPKIICLAIKTQLVARSNSRLQNQINNNNKLFIISAIAHVVMKLISNISTIHISNNNDNNNAINKSNRILKSCVTCAKNNKYGASVKKIFGTNNVKISPDVVLKIINDIIDCFVTDEKLEKSLTTHILTCMLVDIAKNTFNSFIECSDHSEPSIIGILSMSRLINILDIDEVPDDFVNALFSVVFVKNNVANMSEQFKNVIRKIDKHKFLLQNNAVHVHDVLNFILLPKGLQVDKNVNTNKFELYYIDSLYKQIIITNGLKQHFENIKIFMLNNVNNINNNVKNRTIFDALINLPNSINLRMDILNIVSLHFDLLKKIDTCGRFWTHCIFYTFDTAIYGAFINRYRNNKDSYPITDDNNASDAINDSISLVAALTRRLHSVSITYSSDTTDSDNDNNSDSDNSTAEFYYNSCVIESPQWYTRNIGSVNKCLNTTIMNHINMHVKLKSEQRDMPIKI